MRAAISGHELPGLLLVQMRTITNIILAVIYKRWLIDEVSPRTVIAIFMAILVINERLLFKSLC